MSRLTTRDHIPYVWDGRLLFYSPVWDETSLLTFFGVQQDENFAVGGGKQPVTFENPLYSTAANTMSDPPVIYATPVHNAAGFRLTHSHVEDHLMAWVNNHLGTDWNPHVLRHMQVNVNVSGDPAKNNYENPTYCLEQPASVVETPSTSIECVPVGTVNQTQTLPHPI